MKNKENFIFRFSICILAWIALTALFLHLLIEDGGGSVANTFSFFTVQSNTLVLLWITLAVAFHNKDQKPFLLNPAIHGAIMLYISIVFLVFTIILAPSYHPTGFEAVYNILAHYIIPIAFFIDWIITGNDVEYEWKNVIYWLIYPFFYLVYTLIRGYFTGWYPYFFLDPNFSSIGFFIIALAGVSFFCLFVTCIFILLNRRIYKSRNK